MNTNDGNVPKYIVIHETDNWRVGANAKAHAKAQSLGNLSTSVHYYVGSDGVYQAAEHNRCCWSIGRTYLTKREIMDAENYNTINIEICVNADGVYEVAFGKCIELVKHLIATTGIPCDRVIRHYDAKGKWCPRSMMDNKSKWENFKKAISTTNKENANEEVFVVKFDSDIQDLQWCLNRDGYSEATIGRDLVEDGIWGEKTDAVIRKVYLGKGHGKPYNTISWVQCRIGDDITGKITDKTETLITKYKKSKGLVADKVIDPTMMFALVKQYGQG